MTDTAGAYSSSQNSMIGICVMIVLSIIIVYAPKKEMAIAKTVKTKQNRNLTSDKELQGERKFGEDSYVRSYETDYKEYSGEEKIFGGTALERDNGNEIRIECNIRMKEGEIRLLLQTGDSDPKVLFETSGNYSDTIELPAASNYITTIKIIKGRKKKLTIQRSAQYETYKYFKEYQKELQTVCSNADSIPGQPHMLGTVKK